VPRRKIGYAFRDQRHPEDVPLKTLSRFPFNGAAGVLHHGKGSPRSPFLGAERSKTI